MKTKNRFMRLIAIVTLPVACAMVWAILPASQVGATAEVNEFPSPVCITRGRRSNSTWRITMGQIQVRSWWK